MKRLGVTVAIVCSCLAFPLGGCSVVGKVADKVTNKGGDTTCKEFKAQDEAKRDEVISKMLKDRNDGKEAENLKITLTRGAVDAYCKILGKESTKISESGL